MMDTVEVKEAIQALAGELITARRGAPVKIVYTVTGLYMNLLSTCFIYKPDLYGDSEGLILPVEVSHNAMQIAGFIRERCYVPEKGTWYSMKFIINADNSADITLNFDDEPTYLGESLEPQQYAIEMMKFPVTELNRKDWMKANLKTSVVSSIS